LRKYRVNKYFNHLLQIRKECKRSNHQGFKAFWRRNKKYIPLYDSHYPKEFFLNTVQEFQLLRTYYPSMDKAETVNKDYIHRTAKATYIDICTVPARSTATLNVRIYSLTN